MNTDILIDYFKAIINQNIKDNIVINDFKKFNFKFISDLIYEYFDIKITNDTVYFIGPEEVGSGCRCEVIKSEILKFNDYNNYLLLEIIHESLKHYLNLDDADLTFECYCNIKLCRNYCITYDKALLNKFEFETICNIYNKIINKCSNPHKFIKISSSSDNYYKLEKYNSFISAYTKFKTLYYVDFLESEIDKLKSEIKELKKLLNIDKIKTIKDENEKIKPELTTLKSENEKLLIQEKDLKQKLENLDEENEKLKSENDELKEKMKKIMNILN